METRDRDVAAIEIPGASGQALSARHGSRFSSEGSALPHRSAAQAQRPQLQRLFLLPGEIRESNALQEATDTYVPPHEKLTFNLDGNSTGVVEDGALRTREGEPWLPHGRVRLRVLPLDA